MYIWGNLLIKQYKIKIKEHVHNITVYKKPSKIHKYQHTPRLKGNEGIFFPVFAWVKKLLF